MKLLFVYGPIAVVALLFLLGFLRLRRTIAFALCYVLLCAAIAFGGLLWSAGNIREGAISGLVIAICAIGALPLSFLFALLFGVATSKPVSPAPVEEVARVYSSLDDHQKEAFWKAAKFGAKFAAPTVAAFLTTKGLTGTAHLIRKGSKML